MLKPDFFLKTGRRQQLTRQLITARVQVIASTLPPHTSAAHFSEMVTTLAPARIVVVSGRRCVGGPVDGGLSNNHGTCLSNEKRISTTVESSHAARD